MVSHKYLTDINGGDWLELKSLIYCVHTALQIHTLELRIGVGQGINVGPGKLLGQQSVIHQNGLTTKRIQLLSLDSNIAELGLIEISIAAFKCQVPK